MSLPWELLFYSDIIARKGSERKGTKERRNPRRDV